MPVAADPLDPRCQAASAQWCLHARVITRTRTGLRRLAGGASTMPVTHSSFLLLGRCFLAYLCGAGAGHCGMSTSARVGRGSCGKGRGGAGGRRHAAGTCSPLAAGGSCQTLRMAEGRSIWPVRLEQSSAAGRISPQPAASTSQPHAAAAAILLETCPPQHSTHAPGCAGTWGPSGMGATWCAEGGWACYRGAQCSATHALLVKPRCRSQAAAHGDQCGADAAALARHSPPCASGTCASAAA